MFAGYPASGLVRAGTHLSNELLHLFHFRVGKGHAVQFVDVIAVELLAEIVPKISLALQVITIRPLRNIA